jgi:hypothetical protein
MFYLVNAVDGARIVLEHLRGNPTTSPGGRYVVWFGADYHWCATTSPPANAATLTGPLPVPFHQ